MYTEEREEVSSQMRSVSEANTWFKNLNCEHYYVKGVWIFSESRNYFPQESLMEPPPFIPRLALVIIVFIWGHTERVLLCDTSLMD